MMNIKLTEEQAKELVSMYQQKISIKELSKYFGYSVTTISKLLKLNGITPTKCGYSSPIKFSKEKEEEIIKLYKGGMSQKDIATKYNTFNTSIRRVLLRNNVIPRSSTKVNRYCKHNPFKRNDEMSEYFLGLLLTDGCISKEKKASRAYSISLSLSEVDKYIVEAFRNWVSPKLKVSKILQKLNNSYMYSVVFSNDETEDWLRRRGNFYNKSYECKIYCPITWHILRGIFDGDGGFHLANRDGLNFFICGLSKDFMHQIHQFLLKEGLRASIRFAGPDKWHKNGLYYVEIHNYADVIKVGLNMYSNAHIFIKRKYEKWLTFYESKRDNYSLNSGKEWQSNPEQNLPTLEVITK